MKEKGRQSKTTKRFYGYGIAIFLCALFASVGVLSSSYHYAYNRIDSAIKNRGTVHTENPFPIGVNPRAKTITENALVDKYLYDHLTYSPAIHTGIASVVEAIMGELTLFTWYQNIASLSTRILVIESGERKEQVASHFGKILGWSDDEEREFLAMVISFDPVLFEGKFAPGTYIVPRDAKPQDVALLVSERFSEMVLNRYPSSIEQVVPLNDTLVIASLLEREAYDFEDMRYIAGIIWNRLFIDMRLQIDATLQYAKGPQSAKTWWPRVVPDDKYIDSTYNTYMHEGLPPTPIANPSANAILAALNPRETSCMYYFHDSDGGFHCAETYEEHVSLLKEYYGQGK